MRIASFIGSPRTAGPQARDVLRLALPCQPAVPEIQPRRRAELAAQLAAGHVERVVIAELHLPDVLVVERLDPLDERPALLHVGLLPQLGEQALLLLIAPPALERATERDVQRGVGVQG